MSTPTTPSATCSSNSSSSNNAARQIPIVCPGHTRPLAELQFLSVQGQETLLISACHDKMPMVRDGTTGDWIGTFVGHKGAVWSCRMDPSGSLAATAGGDFSAKVWDAITGQSLYDFPHEHVVKCCDFSPDSMMLATGGHEGILRIYDLKLPNKPPLQIAQSQENKVTISKLNWYDRETVITASTDGLIRFWNISKTNAPTHTLKVNADVRDMEYVKLATTGQEMLTVAAGSTVYFFDLGIMTLVHEYPMPIHFRDEGGASLHPDGTKFVAGGSDLWVRVFSFETGQMLECHKGHHGPIRCLRFAPDGKTYATGSEDGTIRLWKTDLI